MMAIENYDHCLRFQVLDKRISLIDVNAASVVADNRGCICVHIEFDDQWDGCGKTARFIYNGEWKDAVLDANGECICPSEVLKKGRFYLGVYGADLKTTTPIAITVDASILSESGQELPDDPTPGQYEQIMKMYGEAIESLDSATQACWDAVEEVESASKLLVDTKEELENGGFIEGFKEKNNGDKFSVWIGTQKEYDSLEQTISGCFYIITDDKSREEITSDVLSRVRAELIDYVVERGTVGAWTYEKWNSGKMELWGRFESTTKAPDDASGTTCRFSSALPVTFASHPVLVVSGLQLKTYSSYIMMSHADTESIGIYMKCANPINSEYPCYFQAHMIGRWK